MEDSPAGRGLCSACRADINLIRIPVSNGAGGTRLSRRLLASHARGREGLPALVSQLCPGSGTRDWTETQPEASP